MRGRVLPCGDLLALTRVDSLHTPTQQPCMKTWLPWPLQGEWSHNWVIHETSIHWQSRHARRIAIITSSRLIGTQCQHLARCFQHVKYNMRVACIIGSIVWGLSVWTVNYSTTKNCLPEGLLQCPYYTEQVETQRRSTIGQNKLKSLSLLMKTATEKSGRVPRRLANRYTSHHIRWWNELRCSTTLKLRFLFVLLLPYRLTKKWEGIGRDL